MKINGNANASADANTDDNVCGGTRAQAIARFWEASRAWYDVDGAAHGWTVEDLLNRLKPMTYFVGPLSMQAGELLGRVIEDLHRRPHFGNCEVVSMLTTEDSAIAREVKYFIPFQFPQGLEVS